MEGMAIIKLQVVLGIEVVVQDDTQAMVVLVEYLQHHLHLVLEVVEVVGIITKGGEYESMELELMELQAILQLMYESAVHDDKTDQTIIVRVVIFEQVDDEIVVMEARVLVV